MKAHYLLEITTPNTHLAKVTMTLSDVGERDQFELFLPSWSPGSYLMREYARNIQGLRVLDSLGKYINFEQIAKGIWNVDAKNTDGDITVVYEVYCHEVSVRTSYIDASHAFLHGPTLFLGTNTGFNGPLTLEVRFPESWSKVSTALKDISEKREVFLYSAKNYDELLDTPLELGCHETDGFMSHGAPHELAFYGTQYPHDQNLKKDIQIIVEHIAKYMGGIPYEKYTFITHFGRNIYGGLEHANSTALQFDGRKLGNRQDYLNWLSLVAHEYFHLWNIKRIRPKELGPFDYLNENYTTMLWLAEGLTSFMDELFVLRAGLSTIDEYLELIRSAYNKFLDTPGRRFHSLETSSFNAWIKLYRADENTANTSVSYYTKGGIAFFILNVLLTEKGKSIDDLVKLLWDSYQENPKEGLTTNDVLTMVEGLVGKKETEYFDSLLKTTEDIDFDKYLNQMGLRPKYDSPAGSYLGIREKYIGDQVFIASVILDGPAHKWGLNAEDEIISVNGLRVLKDDYAQFSKLLKVDRVHNFLVSRGGKLVELNVMLDRMPKRIQKIEVADLQKVQKTLGLK